MGSFCSRDRSHKNRLEDVPDLAEISSIQSPDYVLERKMTNIRKSISLARRMIVLSPRTSSSSVLGPEIKERRWITVLHIYIYMLKGFLIQINISKCTKI